MGKLKSMSLKKSFCLIVFIAAMIVIVLSTAAVKICSQKHDEITVSHAFIANGALIYPENGRYIMEAAAGDADADTTTYTDSELLICRTLEILIVLLPVLFSVLGIGCAAISFYHIKLKEPLKALQQGIDHISNNDLDFTIDYQKNDELGKLCSAFECMRRELVRNNRHMWNLVDERKKINASISHDLRTPITVIKGYSEYLDKNTGKGTLTERGIQEIAVYIHQAAGRLEEYADSVHEMQSLEDMRLEYREVSLSAFEEEMVSQFSVIGGQTAKKICVSSELPQQTVILSTAAVFRITENIISNALRYCKEKIEVDISFSQPFLIVMVTDDGKGFSQKDLAEATDYFYKGKSSKDHFGIGLSICKMLSEKHGGCIRLDNAPGKGARVTVKIKTENLSAL
ncbi:MAG: HAMP domain-containing histidine kinase [Lachnospiraceae bacterium]|nr:HAMP domain-containing histidine kinase [Lachnospiraceae bacterium]